MQFKQAEPNENFSVLRLVSETGAWEVGFYPVLFGVRVGLMKPGSMCYSLNYCAADNILFAEQILITVIAILQPLPETVTEREIKELFPDFVHKPIDRDLCWGKLYTLATGKVLPSITCPRRSCGRTSYSQKDIEQRYCGSCRSFHDDIALEER